VPKRYYREVRRELHLKIFVFICEIGYGWNSAGSAVTIPHRFYRDIIKYVPGLDAATLESIPTSFSIRTINIIED
jgi:hypothetical protein